jgi:hypothetical protein
MSEDGFSHSDEDRGGNGLIQLMDSLKPSTSTAAENSNSMSLIDDSAKHLYELMKSSAPTQGQEFNSERVKAVCQTAKEMREMLRLKLDILREFRK